MGPPPGTGLAALGLSDATIYFVGHICGRGAWGQRPLLYQTNPDQSGGGTLRGANSTTPTYGRKGASRQPDLPPQRKELFQGGGAHRGEAVIKWHRPRERALQP